MASLLPQIPEVGLGDLPPPPYYFQHLLGHPRPQGIDGVGMAETVRMHALDVGSLRQAPKQLAYPVRQ